METYFRQRKANNIFHRVESFLIEIIRNSGLQVVHDTIAVEHYGSAELKRGSAHYEELLNMASIPHSPIECVSRSHVHA